MVMPPQVRRSVTSVVCLIAVACASFAWTAIVYLRTWADPDTPSRVVSAVLADADARDEVLAPFQAQLAQGAEQLPEGIRAEAAIDIVLADPDRRQAIADAYAPPGGGVDPSAARAALATTLAEVDPALADRVADVGPELALPDLSSVAALRPTADTWAWRIAAVALALFALAFAFGDRAMAARRYGWWACGTGLAWWLGPWAIGAAARRWLPRYDATAAVVVDAYVGQVRPWAIGLAGTGLAALTVAVAVWGRRTAGSEAEPNIAAGPGRRQAAIDETRPIPATPVRPHRAPVEATLPIPVAPPEMPRPAAPFAATALLPDDVDVWTAYATPAPDPAAATATGTAAAWAAARQASSARPGRTSPDS